MAEKRTNDDTALGEPNEDGLLPPEDPTPFQRAEEKKQDSED